jgi:arginine exporter protein ArgO
MNINTDSLQIILKGLALGFSIAAPVGPIGILCIRRRLARGFKSGAVSGPSAMVNLLKQRLNSQVIFYVNKIAALTIAGFGVYLILSQVL